MRYRIRSALIAITAGMMGSGLLAGGPALAAGPVVGGGWNGNGLVTPLPVNFPYRHQQV